MQNKVKEFIKNNIEITTLIVILISSILRSWIAFSGQIDLAQDEAQYWDWSRNLQLSYYSKGPLIAWIIAVTSSIFGDTEVGVRFGAVLINFCTQLVIYYWIAKLLKKPKLALIAILIANSMPVFIVSGILITTDNPLLLCWIVGLASLSSISQQGKLYLPFVFLFLAISFGILAKYMMLAFAGIAVIYISIIYYLKVIDSKKLFYSFAAIICGIIVGFLPILLWNIQNDFVSFKHVAKLAGVTKTDKSFFRVDLFPEYLAGQAGLVLPWWLLFTLIQSFYYLKDIIRTTGNVRKNIKDSIIKTNNLNKNNLSQIDGSFCFKLLLIISFLPLWLFFLIWSFHTRIYLNWPTMSYASGMILASIFIYDSFKNIKLTKFKKYLFNITFCLSFIVFLVIYAQNYITTTFNIPSNINPTIRLKGWSSLGKFLGEIENSLPNSKEVFLFSDAYDVTAELAFYGPNKPRAYCADFGRRVSQYDLWESPNQSSSMLNINKDDIVVLQVKNKDKPFLNQSSKMLGWSAIFVTRKPIQKAPEELYHMFDYVGKPSVFVSTHKGQEGRSFGYIILKGYKGIWPLSLQSSY